DDEGYSLRPDEEEGPGSDILYHLEHFFSSSESEGEEDHRKKFKIKIKPLPAENANCLAPSVDELKASIGNIALSPSPLVSLPSLLCPHWSHGVIFCYCILYSRMCLNCCTCLLVAPVPSTVPSSPKASTHVSPTSPPAPVEAPSRTIPPPLVLAVEERKSPEAAALPVPPAPPKEDLSETTTIVSPKDVGQVSRVAPPPPPPPTYRAVVSSPGPTTGGTCRVTHATVLLSSSPSHPPSSPTLPSSSPCSLLPPPTTENDQPSLVWFDRGKFYLTFEGCSRGPSPLTMGAQDTLPVAAAFTETVNAFFKGADPNKCVVKITGEMVLSFPAGITRHFANNPSPAVLTFSITNYSRLEHVLPNPQLLCCDTATTPNPDCKNFWVNMPNLMTHLKKVAEQKPQATYYNVDMLKYQVSAQGLISTPLNLAASWRCVPTSTDLRIDYKYNGNAMTTPVALNNVQFLIHVDGGVTKLQAVLPAAAWNAEQQRILWKIPDISQKSENGGVGSLLARFQLSEGPSKPSSLAVQFTSEGSTLSGCDIELAGPGYRFSLVKKRFAAGKYLADN
uniref:SH3GL interacting endocytic adaptor 1 n=1 Tax=Hucho hucho TaxID=62062 RepID=A0A4W5PAC2_9TELE